MKTMSEWENLNNKRPTFIINSKCSHLHLHSRITFDYEFLDDSYFEYNKASSQMLEYNSTNFDAKGVVYQM